MEEEQLILSENPVSPVNPVKKWFEYLKVQRNLCILHVSSTDKRESRIKNQEATDAASGFMIPASCF
jgi:hypothetical protein